MKISDSLFVMVRSRDKTFFNDKVKAISSFNEKGPFDILPKHANFISIIKDSVVLHKETGEKEEIIIEGGVIRAFENHVNVFIGVFPHPKSP